jgi:hypothetical protein
MHKNTTTLKSYWLGLITLFLLMLHSLTANSAVSVSTRPFLSTSHYGSTVRQTKFDCKTNLPAKIFLSIRTEKLMEYARNCHFTIEIHSRIENYDYVEIRKLIQKVSDILLARKPENSVISSPPTFSLNSKGGDVKTAINIGYFLRSSNLPEWWTIRMEVRPKKVCFSSCVLLLASGEQKLVLGKLGIHRPYVEEDIYQGKNASNIGKKNYDRLRSEISEYFEYMNIPQSLTEKMFSIPSSELKFLDDDDQKHFGLTGLDSVTQEIEIAEIRAACGTAGASQYFRHKNHVRECGEQYGQLDDPTPLSRCIRGSEQLDAYVNCSYKYRAYKEKKSLQMY